MGEKNNYPPTCEEDCPNCHGKNIAYISYGLPNMDLARPLIEAGRISLGGCIVGPNSKEWHCNDCGAEWGAIDHDALVRNEPAVDL
ncbi:hypothetical protein FHR99_003190 [Litorivivens lipolytica]|uniref:Uncharacterized protein n=1 Tax=Litorivivens lipolytica TaxID=1524264 RepID=A0A7W4Z8F7_9GAMM|nr:hypothetical protein [Litorivivens lipolytica]